MASDPKKNYFASATLTVQLRIISAGHWGADATVKEVMEIGARETRQALVNALRESKLTYEILGVPEVGAVTWERTK